MVVAHGGAGGGTPVGNAFYGGVVSVPGEDPHPDSFRPAAYVGRGGGGRCEVHKNGRVVREGRRDGVDLAPEEVWEEGGRNMEPVDSGGMLPMVVSVGSTSGVAMTEGILELVRGADALEEGGSHTLRATPGVVKMLGAFLSSGAKGS